MNFLAHAYLSFDHNDILVGNMISDFVKGNKKDLFSVNIQKGIVLHRAIDAFTDQHKATSSIKNILKPAVGLYAAVFSDIVYDYFLANDILVFKDDEALYHFSQETYGVLQNNFSILPENFKQILPYMIHHNWLYNYKQLEGINSSFKGVFRRAKYLEYTPAAFECFVDHLQDMQSCYNYFFKDVKSFAADTLYKLLKD